MVLLVPGLCGIKGNEEANSAAKEALLADLKICAVPPMDLKTIICDLCNKMLITNGKQTEIYIQ